MLHHKINQAIIWIDSPIETKDVRADFGEGEWALVKQQLIHELIAMKNEPNFKTANKSFIGYRITDSFPFPLSDLSKLLSEISSDFNRLIDEAKFTD